MRWNFSLEVIEDLVARSDGPVGFDEGHIACLGDGAILGAMPVGDQGVVEQVHGEADAAFREPENQLVALSPLQRLRWLQQTAYFIWKHKGAANRRGHHLSSSEAEPDTDSG